MYILNYHLRGIELTINCPCFLSFATQTVCKFYPCFHLGDQVLIDSQNLLLKTVSVVMLSQYCLALDLTS